MRAPKKRHLALIVGPLLGLAIAAPAWAGVGPPTPLPRQPTSHARSTPTVPDKSASAMAGFILWEDPGVNHSTAYNSSGGGISVNPGGTGAYQVLFGNLGFGGGDVQVSGTSPDSTCAVAGWGPSGSSLSVLVDCYDATGAPADSAFEVMVTRPRTRPNGVLDYAYAYKANGKLTGSYQFNSSHKVNSIKQLGTGRYVVTMPGPGLSGATAGTVKVSAYGGSGGACQVASWTSTGAGQRVGVDCFSATGARQNRPFTLVYARANNLMGLNGKVDANALVGLGGTVYQPRYQYDSKHLARVTIVHLDRGEYEALLAGSGPTGHFSGGDGDLQFTVMGGTYHRCGFAPLPLRTPLVLIECVDAHAHRSNTAFALQWVET